MTTFSSGIENLFKIEKMKRIVFAITASTLIISCSKEDPKPVIIQAVSPAATYLYTGGLKDIPDRVGSTNGLFTAEINVTADGIIGDASKVTIDIGLTHTYAGDLKIVLITPDGSFCNLSNREGGDSNFIAANIVSFNSTFTALIPGFGVDIPTGNYKQAFGIFGSPSDVLIADLLVNKRILGVWKLKVYDEAPANAGTFSTFKINLASGALK